MSGLGFSHKPKIVSKIKTNYRVINTQIPVPESIHILEELYKKESNAMHGQLPIIWDRAEGYQVFDMWGNKWLDFSSTIFVTNAGHGNSRITKALKKVIDKSLLHTYTFTSPERADYINYLIKNTPPKYEKAFLMSAGTEATECALKLMRLNGQKLGKRKGGIICFEGNWHGRTMGAQMMGWNPSQKEWIGYHDPNIYHLPFPYPWKSERFNQSGNFFRRSLNDLIEKNNIDPLKDISGIMMETFQGWGALFYPKEFVQEVRKFADENNIILTFDEMQSGFGRTGKLFGYMNYDIEPDLLCCGKGSSSSLPLSMVLGSEEVMDLPDIGSMSSTHSANPLVCAAGKANLESIIEDGLVENSSRLGKLFHEELNKIKLQHNNYLAYVEGKGLLAALIFYDKHGKPLNSLCDKISELCLQKGLIVVHTGRESIKLAPPLMIDEEALLEGLSVLNEAINEAILD